jgi:hypothetical protein
VSIFNFAGRHGAVLSIICLSFGAGAAGANEIDVVGGNSSNSRMFWLNYDAADPFNNAAVQLNNDASSYPNLNSFTFFRNTCGDAARSDIIAASTNASQLVIYREGKGTGTPICTGNCPPRPDGLSTSNQQVISVATSGASGSTPAIWLFKPQAACTANEQPIFERVGNGQQFTAGTVRIRAIADTEFALADSGVLVEGDLLVLSSNPALVARVPKAAVDAAVAAAAGSSVSLNGEVLVDSSHFGRATPTGLAIVPGDGGNLLVTLSTGEVRHVNVSKLPAVSKRLVGSAGLFPNPRGIAAGVRRGTGTQPDETYMVVSDQNQGRYIRAVLEVTSSEPFLSMNASARRTVLSPVGAPQGVAINQNDPNVSFATECFKPGTDVLTGCKVAGGLGELHFQQGFDGDLDPDAQVRVELQFIRDPVDNSQRDEFGRLKLPYDGQDFFVPATCRGFNTSNADASFGFGGVPQLVLLDIELLNFSVSAGNFAQVTERVKEILNLPQAASECTHTGARIYYHPSKDLAGDPLDGGTLFDTTVSCQNPSRGISEVLSPFVFCVDPVYVARKSDPTFGREAFVNVNIRRYLTDLKDAVDELGAFPALRQELNSLLTGFTNPDMSPGKVPAYYIETSANADRGALAVLAMNRLESGSIFKETEGLPRDLYARLLRGFLGLAFYTKETGALQKYYPPAEFCKPYNEYEGKKYPELPDVKCDCGTQKAALEADGYLCAP